MLAGFISTRAGRRLLERLASHGEPPLVWRHLESLRDRVADEQHQPLDGLLLDLIADGTLVASKEAPAPGGTMHVALEQPAAARAAAATEELQRLRSLVALGDRAAETELAGFIAPLVERAVERSTGNTRLQSDYQELNAAFGTSAGEPSTESALDADVVADISDALAPIEIEVELAGGAIRVRDRGASAEQLVRAVALVDQRLSRTPASDTRTTLPQVQRALAVRATEAGVAQDLLSALFERGPLFQVAVGLSPDTRLELLNAARVAGFEIPARWTSHQVLGGWLREALGEAPSTGITDSGDALTRLAEVEAARREMEQRLHDARLAAREAFAVAASVPLDHLEQTADAYVQLWLGLSRLGIRQIAALGQLMQRDELDPNRHELVGDDTGESTVLFVVRSAGLAVGDRIVRRARLEAAS